MKNEIILIENPKAIENCDFIQVYSFPKIMEIIALSIDEVDDSFDIHSDSEKGLRITLKGNCCNVVEELKSKYDFIEEE